MVRKRAENGSYYHEPPYTEEESMEIYRLDAPGMGPRMRAVSIAMPRTG